MGESAPGLTAKVKGRSLRVFCSIDIQKRRPHRSGNEPPFCIDKSNRPGAGVAALPLSAAAGPVMHHLRFAQPQAMGARVSDKSTVPLCRTHHREVHRIGDAQGWWARRGVDALTIASTLWRQTRSTRPTQLHDRCWY